MDTITTKLGFAPTKDVDLSKPLAWPNPDGTVTVWPPCPVHGALVCACHLNDETAADLQRALRIAHGNSHR